MIDEAAGEIVRKPYLTIPVCVVYRSNVACGVSLGPLNRENSVCTPSARDLQEVFACPQCLEETAMGMPAQPQRSRRVHLAVQRNFLVRALPESLGKRELHARLKQADVLEDSTIRAQARSSLVRTELDIEGAFMPTRAEIDVARLIQEMVEVRTQAKGDSLVQVRQDATRAIYHARLGMQELCSQDQSVRTRRVLLVAAPLSMEAHKLAFAMQWHYGVCRRYERVDEFDEQGQPTTTTGRIHHWPFLVIRVSVRLNDVHFVAALLQSMDAFLHEGLLDAYRRSRMTALEIIIRTLSALHVSAIAIIGLNSRHAKNMQELADFFQTLGNLADAGFGVAVFLASGLLHGRARDALDLLSVGAVQEIVPHGPGEDELIANLFWSKLPTVEPMPGNLPVLIRAVQGHRMAFPLMFFEINRRLHRQRLYDPNKLTDGLIEASCPRLMKYVKLYGKGELEYLEAVRYADWISYRARVKPRTKARSSVTRTE
ncbi:hypothetical protein [Cupriavidus pauculus]|uniref:hypothetical protein n=1 Tax=Cupriavidus pauculus TaxID=82633 RepID=UPI001EE3683D|nr:hypothetical protein [Cupriavidus pauculus]GJG94345.1 hypothetical protein CBA19C6_07670 [Cupriavidus pauculus]